MDAEAVRSLVAEHYGLGTPTRVELLTKGQNDTYVVETTDDRYAFRVYGSGKPWIRGDDDLRFELDLLTHLHAQRAPVSYPLPTRDGSTLGRVSTSTGERRCALFTWAYGQPMDSEHWAPEAANRLGHALATIHVAADSFTTTYSRYRFDVSTLLDRSTERMRNQLERADPTIVALIEQQVAEIRRRLQDFDPGPGGWGIIHADPQSLNIHVAGDAVTFFDFDLCGLGWRAHDIAYALRHTGSRERSGSSASAGSVLGWIPVGPTACCIRTRNAPDIGPRRLGPRRHRDRSQAAAQQARDVPPRSVPPVGNRPLTPGQVVRRIHRHGRNPLAEQSSGRLFRVQGGRLAPTWWTIRKSKMDPSTIDAWPSVPTVAVLVQDIQANADNDVLDPQQ